MSDIGQTPLPPGWAWATVGQLSWDSGYGTSVKCDYDADGPPVLRIPNIAAGHVDLQDLKFATDGASLRPDQSLSPGDLLIVRTNGSRNLIGQAAVINRYFDQPHFFASYLIRFRLRETNVLPRFMATIWDSPYVREWMEHTASTSAGQYNINSSQLSLLCLPLPPLNEQSRIVAEIEKQFSRLDAGVTALKRVQANLKRYRAAVLRAACEGRLVPTKSALARQEGRDYEPVDLTVSHRSSLDDLQTLQRRAGRLWGAGVVPELTQDERNKLPEGWRWTKVVDLGSNPDETVQVGPMSMRSQDFEERGVPVLNVGCVQWGWLDASKLNYLPMAKAAAFERYRIKPGDVLFTRSGTVGRAAIAKRQQAGWLMTFHLLRVRPDSHVCLPEFLRTVFEGANHIRRQTRDASIGTTRAGFNTALLQNLDVPLPPIAEQERIVAEVERRLSFVDELEAAVGANLKRAERLRRAVLKRAFEGRLVPQDPNDEPASVLLERIRAERNGSPTVGKGRTTGRQTQQQALAI